MQISYNKLRTFGECALKYRLAYLERLPRPPLATLAFERRLHAALAQYHFFARRDGVVREEELLEAYARMWDASRRPQVRQSKRYLEGEEILRRYCAQENTKQRVPAYVEHTLRVPLGPYTLTGKVDRIDFAEKNAFSIVDYKLDRRIPDPHAAQKNRQLSFYSLLAQEGLGAPIPEVRLYFLRHGIEQVSHPTRAQHKETLAWIDATASAIHKEKQWQPCQGPGCPTCAFHKLCPAKTGSPRPLQAVWEQGNLLWEMQDPSEEAAPPPIQAVPSAEADAAPPRVRQLTLEEFL